MSSINDCCVISVFKQRADVSAWTSCESWHCPSVWMCKDRKGSWRAVCCRTRISDACWGCLCGGRPCGKLDTGTILRSSPHLHLTSQTVYSKQVELNVTKPAENELTFPLHILHFASSSCMQSVRRKSSTEIIQII